MYLSSFALFTILFCLLDFTPSQGVVMRCPTRTLRGGRVRLRSKGRVAKYVCMRGYQVLGDKYSTCIRGKWDSPVPVCISNGCLPIDVPHGQVLETYRGAFLTVHCDPGYSLVGSQNLFCNGAKWNGTAPFCREMKVNAQKWCDFEDEDLCGWTHDMNHDFDWTRHSFATPSGHVGTGPSFDHTLGPSLNGHYMYLESSSPRLQNDTARLFSPVFGATNGSNTCFIFWYHMYGLTTGTLNVYLHSKESAQLFSLSGDQGNVWQKAVLPLPPLNYSFQIVIEGVRGSGYVGDTAIDDVKLAEGEECEVSPSSGSTDAEDSSEVSCESRCYSPTVNLSWCECSADCLGNNTCCHDFLTECNTLTSSDAPNHQQTLESESTLSSSVQTIVPSSAQASSLSTNPPSTETSVKLLPTSTTTVTYTSTVTPSTNYSFNGLPSSKTEVKTVTSVPTTYTPPIVLKTRSKEPLMVSESVKVTKTPSHINSTISSTDYTSIPVPAFFGKSQKMYLLSTKKPWPQGSSDSKKPKLEFVTPPPPVVFRTPASAITTRPTLTFTSTSRTSPSMTTASTNLPRYSTSATSKTVLRYSTITSLGTKFVPTYPTVTTLQTKFMPRYSTKTTSGNSSLQTTTLRSKLAPKSFSTTTLRNKLAPRNFNTTTLGIGYHPKDRNTSRSVPIHIVPFIQTTIRPKFLKNSTVEPPKSKNDVLHPVWSKSKGSLPVPPPLPPLGPKPGASDNMPSQQPPSFAGRDIHVASTAEKNKWKSKFSSRDHVPVHAPVQAAQSPFPGGVAHIIILVCGSLLLLCSAVAVVCVVRRRRMIRHRRSEDDELDIRFLASDEILDFTLARPSSDNIQMYETTR